MTAGNRELRAELTRLTTVDRPSGENQDQAQAWLDAQITKVAELSQKYPHGIVIVSRCDNNSPQINCFTYAFGLQEDVYIYPADSSFVEFVLPLLEEIKLSEARDGDVLIYFNGSPKHAAEIKGSKFVSKWGGESTHIWEHGLFEVPLEYGDDVKCFRRLSSEQAAKAYQEWWDQRDQRGAKSKLGGL